MSKLKFGTGEYLTSIPQIRLNSNFGSDICEFRDKVAENFQRLISLPFLQGEPGSSIEIKTLNIGSSSSLNKLGQAIFNKIYDSTTIEELVPANDSQFGGTFSYASSDYNSYDSLDTESFNIDFYTHIESDSTGEYLWIASQQLWMFIDARVACLSNLNENEAINFYDLSCGLSITGKIKIDPSTGEIDIDSSDSDYNIIKYNIIPTLYYKPVSGGGYWAWKINGEETSINAQGVDGDDGENAVAYICEGTLVTSNGAPYELKIDSVFSLTNGTISYNINDINNIPEGALCIVWYRDTSKGTNGPLNCTMGNAVETSTGRSIYVRHWDNVDPNSLGINFDFRTLVDDQEMNVLLDDLNHDEDSPAPLRGLYLRDRFTQPANADAHMIWAQQPVLGHNDLTLHFQHVTDDNLRGEWTAEIASQPSDTTSNDNTTVNFHYDNIKKDYIEIGRSLPQVIQNLYAMSSLAGSSNTSDPRDGTVKTTTASIPFTSDMIKTYIVLKDSEETSSENKRVTISSQGIRLENVSEGIYAKNINSGITQSTYNFELSNLNFINPTSNSGFDNFYVNPNSTSLGTQILNSLSGINGKFQFYRQGLLFENSNIFNLSTSYGNSLYDKGVWWKGNNMTFYYSFINDVIQSASPSMHYNVSPLRPRKLKYMPINLGGLATIYNTTTKNITNNVSSEYLLDKATPLILGEQENFDHAFLSGKYGWSNLLALTTSTVSSDTYYNSIIKITVPSSSSGSQNATIGLVTSCAGTWTKIGNVINVQGKIFVKTASVTNDNNSLVVGEPRAITYEQLYKFLTSAGNAITFPFPVVTRTTSGSRWVSTGATMEHESELKDSIFVEGSDRYNTMSIPDILSTSEASILNGTATIHLKGYLANSSDKVASTASIIPLVATLAKVDNQYWKFDTIPSPISKSNNSQTPPYQGFTSSPVVFTANDQFATSVHTQDKYKIISPYLQTWWKSNTSITNIPWLLYIGDNVTNQMTCWTSDSGLTTAKMDLLPSVYIGKYPVHCITFQFSYLLDDDVYPRTDALPYIGGSADTSSPSYSADFDHYSTDSSYIHVPAYSLEAVNSILPRNDIEWQSVEVGSGSSGSGSSGSGSSGSGESGDDSTTTTFYYSTQGKKIYVSTNSTYPWTSTPSTSGQKTLSLSSDADTVYGWVEYSEQDNTFDRIDYVYLYSSLEDAQAAFTETESEDYEKGGPYTIPVGEEYTLTGIQ